MANPTRTEQLDDFYTTTWNNRKKGGAVDQIFNANVLSMRLNKSGQIKFDGTGGRFLEVPLSYSKNETVQSIGRGDTISIADTKFLTVAQYQWKYVAGTVIRYFTDDQENKGKQRIINWANSRLDNLRDSLQDSIDTFLFGDGTGNGSKDPNGLQNLVDITPATGTVGNINAATFDWWQNKLKAASGAASVHLEKDLRNLFNTCSRGQNTDLPTVGVTGQTEFELIEDEVLEIKRINDKMMGDSQFDHITFKGRPIVWSSKNPSGEFRWLNERFIGITLDPDVNSMMTPWKFIPGQLDRVAQVVSKLQFVVTRRASQGVMTGIAA